MKRPLISLVVLLVGLLLGGVVAGWPERVESDVVIESMPSTSFGTGASSGSVADPETTASGFRQNR